MKKLSLLILIAIWGNLAMAQTDNSGDNSKNKVAAEKTAKKKAKEERKAKKQKEKQAKEQKEKKDWQLIPNQDTTKKQIIFRAEITDSSKITNQDAIYTRPFIGLGTPKVAIGGYVEGNTNYIAQDGISDGFTMELRRFNIFLYSSIHRRLRFISELEFEHGTQEISLETALLDFEIFPQLNFRAGILLPQVGVFNANHDSPRWEFIDRPLSSTTIIPSTLSEMGFGLHGKFYIDANNIVSYDAYITNGLQDGVVLNEQGKTFIPSGKTTTMLGEDNNGAPMYNARIGYTNREAGEIGLAYYGGIYNTFEVEGEAVESIRSLSLIALDFTAQIQKARIRGEYVYAFIDVPATLRDIYGTQQNGGFLEIVYPVFQRRILGFAKAEFNIGVRLENVDYNFGVFNSTSKGIGDEIQGITGVISFRPSPSTVFRASYKYQWIYDVLNNPPAHLGGWQFGFATYF